MRLHLVCGGGVGGVMRGKGIVLGKQIITYRWLYRSKNEESGDNENQMELSALGGKNLVPQMEKHRPRTWTKAFHTHTESKILIIQNKKKYLGLLINEGIQVKPKSETPFLSD